MYSTEHSLTLVSKIFTSQFLVLLRNTDARTPRGHRQFSHQRVNVSGSLQHKRNINAQAKISARLTVVSVKRLETGLTTSTNRGPGALTVFRLYDETANDRVKPATLAQPMQTNAQPLSQGPSALVI